MQHYHLEYCVKVNADHWHLFNVHTFRQYFQQDEYGVESFVQ